MNKFLGLTFILFFSTQSYAETKTCKNVYISDVTVEAARDDGFALANTLIIRIKDVNEQYVSCEGKDYFHLENSSPAYSGMLSIALTAQTTKKVVDIAINTSISNVLSHQLSYIYIKSN